jgi:hypothetical protein
MRFSEIAKNDLTGDRGTTNSIPFVYIWGDLNYKKLSEKVKK